MTTTTSATMTKTSDEKRPEGAVCLVPHQPQAVKRLPWPVCRGCGLVYLRNEATRRAIKRGHWKYVDEK